MQRRDFVTIVALFPGACKRAAEGGATRVVSLSPSTTEALFAIGAGALVVGRSRYCDYPASAVRLPQVGGYVDPNLEAIVALAPTLVTGARGPLGRSFVDKLEAMRITTYFPETESLKNIETMLLGLGDRTGRRSDAEDTVKNLNERLRTTVEAIHATTTPRVLLLYGTDPIVAAGLGSFADEMLRYAKATNAVTAGSGYPTMGLEHVVVLDPDIIVNATFTEGTGGKLADRAGWNKVGAVRKGRVFELRDEAVLRPGPRLPEAVKALASLVHPR